MGLAMEEQVLDHMEDVFHLGPDTGLGLLNQFHLLTPGTSVLPQVRLGTGSELISVSLEDFHYFFYKSIIAQFLLVSKH